MGLEGEGLATEGLEEEGLKAGEEAERGFALAEGLDGAAKGFWSGEESGRKAGIAKGLTVKPEDEGVDEGVEEEKWSEEETARDFFGEPERGGGGSRSSGRPRPPSLPTAD